MLSTTQWLMLSTMPLPQLMLLPQLMPPPLPHMLSPRPRMNPTPISTVLLMTTQRLTSKLLRLLMEVVLSLDLTLLPFPTAVPNTSPTPPTTTTDTSPRSPTKELLPTLRPSLTPLPLPIMLKPSLCFVNIYQQYLC